jgi:hypothetical protein
MEDIEKRRYDFLLKLYDQLWNSINARLSLIWESIGILVSAFAIFALTEKNIISLSIASAIMVVLSAWYIAHNIDMSYWYNRNLAMIANIERQFLFVEDAKLIYWYFISHVKKNKMVTYLQIQTMLGFGISLIVLLLHIIQNVFPIIRCEKPFTYEILLPYILLAIAIWLLIRFRNKRNKEYDDFLKLSPGKDISEKAKEIGFGKFV